ncbi:hypothetical protein [Devosia sp.]|uniref:hypothetical protein n=1 Tax=Devosia sp. TaxID=1871048 RepID=UPI001B168DD2|nr:hypothetical protein [Devosia sp.]MBO9590340.1 hypothetical protein [Devosia sp.]
MVGDVVIVIPLLASVERMSARHLRRSDGKIGELLRFHQCQAVRKPRKKRKSVLDFGRTIKT